MTQAINTRGPWDVDGQFGFLDVVSSKGRIAMIDCDNDDIFGADIEANARLIAAAPDLLAACQEMAAQLGGGSDFEQWKAAKAQLIAAIAKAKGA